MDFESTASYLPDAVSNSLSAVAAHLPEELTDLLGNAASYIPRSIDPAGTALFILYFTASSLILGMLARVFLGKRSSLNHSLSSSMSILFVYALTIVIYTFKPWNLDSILSPLPFVRLTGEYLVIIPFQGTGFTTLCSEILSLIILAFLVNLLDAVIPKGKSILGWFCLRFVSVVAAMVLHFLVDWAFKTFMPGVLVTYAPAILLVLLVLLLLMGVLNLILSLVLTAVNPIFGAIYTFFFSNFVGKQLTKAIFSAGIVCIVIFLLGYFGYTVISITGAALMTYIPLAIVLLALWFLIGHVL